MINNHFTIIIPTRERKETLRFTIQTVLNQNYSNYTLLISDNFSQDGTKDMVESFKNDKIKYINTGKRVSMSHNWEYALNSVEGGWVTILGDDDGLLPNSLVKVNRIINNLGIQAIRSNVCSYNWPTLSEEGSLSLTLKKGYKKHDSITSLKLCLNGKIPYTRLPVLYNGGFVDVEILKKIKKISGCFINSQIPDVYLGVAISLIVKEYVYSNEPFAINGASINSGGTAFFKKSSINTTNNAFAKFIEEDNIPFHSAIPLMPSGFPVRSLLVILFESYLQASKLHNDKLTIDFKEQVKVFLKYEFRFREEILWFTEEFIRRNKIVYDYNKYLKKNEISRIQIFINKAFQWPIYQFKRLLSLCSHDIGISGDLDFKVDTVYDASLIAGTFLHFPAGGLLWNIKIALKRKYAS